MNTRRIIMDNFGPVHVTAGMSLRGFFAASAMQGWLASWHDTDHHPGMCQEIAAAIAKRSYAIADAMLKEREISE